MLYLVSKKNRKEMRVCFFARYEKKDRNNNSKANNNIENKQTNKQQEKKKDRKAKTKMSITIQCVQLATSCFFGFSFKNRDEKKIKKRNLNTKNKTERKMESKCSFL